GKDRRASMDVFLDASLQFSLASVRDHEGTELTAALHDAHNRSLIHRAGPANLFATLVDMHVACLATDEGLIGFDCASTFSAKLAAELALHCKADSVEHEPSSFLSNAKRTMQFVRTDPVLAVRKHPQCGKP